MIPISEVRFEKLAVKCCCSNGVGCWLANSNGSRTRLTAAIRSLSVDTYDIGGGYRWGRCEVEIVVSDWNCQREPPRSLLLLIRVRHLTVGRSVMFVR